MSTVFAGRFNFGFVFLLVVVLSPLFADTNHTTTDEVPDFSKEVKSLEEFPRDNLNSISTSSHRDNSIDGNLSITANVQTTQITTNAETETHDLSTTKATRNAEVIFNAAVESISITTPKSSYERSVDVSETTIAHVEDDQMTTANSAVNASWIEKINTTTEPVQNDSIQHQENINLQFSGNFVEDFSNSSIENKTVIADRTINTNAKPTKETIMGVGVKTTVSVSLRVQNAKITSANLTEEENSTRNSNCKNSVSNNSTETTNSIQGNATCFESMENATVTDNSNETAHSTEVLQKSNIEPPALKSTPETEHQNNSEINWNSTNGIEIESTSYQPNNTESYSNSTETGLLNTTFRNKIENDSNSTQLNTTEINSILNVTEPTTFEERSNSSQVPITERRITDTPLPNNATTEVYTETSTSFTITNNDTSERLTTHAYTQVPTTSTSLSSTDAETENATDLMITTPQPIIKFAGVMKIVQGLNWSVELLNRQSLEYRKVASVMQILLEDVFSSALAGILKEIEIDGFSQGSVLVDYFLTLLESDEVDANYLFHMFNRYFKNNTYNGFTIDLKATEFEVIKVKAIKPTTESRVEPPVPQWVVAVVVISAASLVFIILFAAVTIYGRHYGRRSYNKKLQGDEIIFDKPDYQSGPRLSDAAYENLAADAVYDVEGSPEKIDGVTNSADNQFDSWRTNRLTRMPSTKRFSFNSS